MDWMKDDGINIPMLNDTSRNKFYDDAIALAAPGKIVVDIGTGTGILSILAARAGAKKVYAVEQDQARAEYSRAMFERVGLGNVIEIVHDDFLNTNIPADIYVSETINTQIFGEGVLEIAEHARKHGGTFLPSKFEITAEVYDNHPIFVLCQYRSDAFEFQPDISIDPVFEEAIASSFQADNSLENTLYRANVLNGLFTQLPKFKDLKLQKLYTSEPLIVDLNQPVNIDNIRLTIPADISNNHNTNNIYVVITWKAHYQNVIMRSDETWFGNSSKTILRRTRNRDIDITMWYDPLIRDWRFKF